ncbi:MAG: hypothetical protein ABIM31_01785 [candidate division WOR-3 bacterium]
MWSDELTREEQDYTERELLDFIEKLSDKIVSLKLTTIAIVTLESIKPLSFLTSQAMVFFEPFIKTFFTFKDYGKLYKILEDRKFLEMLITKIEEKSEQ